MRTSSCLCEDLSSGSVSGARQPSRMGEGGTGMLVWGQRLVSKCSTRSPTNCSLFWLLWQGAQSDGRN